MYTENNRYTTAERANDDFLRRMLGGELSGNARAVMNEVGETPQKPHQPGCRMEDGEAERREGLGDVGTQRPRAEERPNCNEVDGNGCPKYLYTPSLAMVYAPYQCWQNLLDPEAALEHGSQFSELILPFEAGGRCMRMGGGKGRCKDL